MGVFFLNIKDNSKKINKGDIFIALDKGHNYIDDAIKNGASLIIAEYGNYSAKTLIVKNTRKYLIKYLKDTYYNEIKDMNIIGITGTNGKTTTAYLIYQALNLLGDKCAYIGTIGFYINDKVRDLNNTTPDLIDLYEMILEAKKEGCTNIVMEVSSHSLDQRRVDAIKFNYALFTNLTKEHLNYHKDMNKYFKAKKRLLKLLKNNGKIIINDDDKYFKKIKRKSIRIGFNSKYKISDYKIKNNTSFIFNNKKYNMKLLGIYNVYNMSFCIKVLECMGYNNLNKIIKKLDPPSGRMEIVKYRNNSIIIDYAHTPDAVTKIISAVREFSKNKIYTIIGCGGNRDISKRPLMAEIATSLSDYVIFTSDNPRFENPLSILDDMTNKLENNNYEIVVNRKDAIKKGIHLLNNNDILLLLGKGHERYQIIEDKKIYFSDLEEVELNIRR